MDWFSASSERKAPWERKWSPRLMQEIEALNRHGRVLNVERPADAPGYLRVRYAWQQGNRTHLLGIIYQPGFPHVRPKIQLLCDPVARPRRHCDPTNGVLCYLGHGKHSWRPMDLTADLIEAQLPGILAGDADEDAIGEPAENWWATWSPGDSMFVVESDWEPGGYSSGTVSTKCLFGPGRPPSVRVLAEKVFGDDGREIAARITRVPVEFEGARSIQLPWLRFDEELFPRDEKAIYRTVQQRAGRQARTHRLNSGLRVRPVVTVFPTEIEHGRQGWAWVLFMFSGDERAFKLGQDERILPYSIRTLRAGADDLLRRAPSAKPLHGRRIVIAGLGSIGAPIALDLARNGVAYLGLIDNDVVSPGNSVRWPFGESAWGRRKLEVLQEEIARASAAVDVEIFEFQIGEQDLQASSGTGHSIGRSLSEADVIIDATANFDALRLIVEHAGRIGKPLVSVNATPTLEGGAVAMFVTATSCPVCLLRHQEDGTIAKPPGDGSDPQTLGLPGCAEATFAGSSFDLGELSLEATRVVMRELRRPSDRSYIETLSFVGSERLPSWQIQHFDRHPDCGCG